MNAPYIGRFAPSPSGPLHAGSLVAAMASFLDARVHDGRWLIRIEDVDEARTVPGAAEAILHTLATCGMRPDVEVLWQSRRGDVYAAAFARLQAQGQVYPCACSRREIADSQAMQAQRAGLRQDGMPTTALPYPGTCRTGMPDGRPARAWRMRVPLRDDAGAVIGFTDRACGLQSQDLAREAGDFVLKRADGFWAYQLAVVVDDGEQGVTDVVRGMDLLDSTPRQIWLQQCLGLPTPRYLHAPLVRNAAGEKLSKQTGADALDLRAPVSALAAAARVLGLVTDASGSVENFWQRTLPQWAARYGMR